MANEIQPGTTALKPWINGEAIDREIAQESPCAECGSPMSFRSERGVDRFGERYYRAFAVCTNAACGEEIEF